MNSEYKNIPEFPGYSICKDGRVFNQLNRKFVTPTRNSFGLPYVRIKNSVSKEVNASVAKLVLHTYKPLKIKWKAIYARK